MSMNYHQTKERYQKREIRQQISRGALVIILGLALWAGWFWGSTQQSRSVISFNQDLLVAQQQNARLEQELASLRISLEQEQQERIVNELLANKGTQQLEMRRLQQTIASHLAKGISEERILRSLEHVLPVSHCQLIDQGEIAVATSFYTSKEANIRLVDGGVSVFAEGEAGESASIDHPWFNITKPISVRAVFLGGEKNKKAVLPFSMNIMADEWMLELKVNASTLRGYISIMVNKCFFS